MTDPDSMFVRGAAQRNACNICFHCPVRLECLADALNSHMDYGVWGGYTERERRAIERRFEDGRDWAERIQDPGDEVGQALRDGVLPSPAAGRRSIRRRRR